MQKVEDLPGKQMMQPSHAGYRIARMQCPGEEKKQKTR